MRNTSSIMYRIGNIFTIIQLVLGPILFLIGLIIAIIGGVQDPVNQAMVNSGSNMICWGIYFVVVSILCLVFVGKAQRELASRNTKNPTPFILTIVFGAIANNVFYVLAGIFGLIADGQDGGQQQP